MWKVGITTLIFLAFKDLYGGKKCGRIVDNCHGFPPPLFLRRFPLWKAVENSRFFHMLSSGFPPLFHRVFLRLWKTS